MQSRAWIAITLSIALSSGALNASEFTVEEERLDKARQALPAVFERMAQFHQSGLPSWQTDQTYQQLQQQVISTGEALWQFAKEDLQRSGSYDDRGLYWERLALTRQLRDGKVGSKVSESEREQLIELLENASRGRTDLLFDDQNAKPILITGFDPFLLDKNISQSNPSGVLALLLDGQIIEHNGIRGEINTVLFPVRYEDFDAGELETLLAPYYALDNLAMVVTVSMGREQFDLEHFPGRRRSASAPDNLNEYAGGSETDPVIPRLFRHALEGPEFVQTSLPIAAMQKAAGEYQINDRRVVTTLESTFEANSLEQLRWATAVRGGGGGYLSNEISYRSIRLRNKIGSRVPTGHIHTPRITEFDKPALIRIAAQLTEMLKQSLSEI